MRQLVIVLRDYHIGTIIDFHQFIDDFRQHVKQRGHPVFVYRNIQRHFFKRNDLGIILVIILLFLFLVLFIIGHFQRNLGNIILC